jgi:hypothetical protein
MLNGKSFQKLLVRACQSAIDPVLTGFRAEEKLFPEFNRTRKALDILARDRSGLRFRLANLASQLLGTR